MRVESRANHAQQDQAIAETIDVSLLGAPEPAELVVPVDQIMVAVDGVQRYVVSHLARIGRACDADDVMQDIRVAVWDGVTRGHYRQLPGVPFGAWVQGVCANVCAAHIRREMTHQTLPLLMDPGSEGRASLDAVTLLGMDRGADRSAEKFVDQQWARTIIELTRASGCNGSIDLLVQLGFLLDSEVSDDLHNVSSRGLDVIRCGTDANFPTSLMAWHCTNRGSISGQSVSGPLQ